MATEPISQCLVGATEMLDELVDLLDEIGNDELRLDRDLWVELAELGTSWNSMKDAWRRAEARD